MNVLLGMVSLRHRLKLKMRRVFFSKVIVLYHLAPLPKYRRKTHYLVLKMPAK